MFPPSAVNPDLPGSRGKWGEYAIDMAAGQQVRNTTGYILMLPYLEQQPRQIIRSTCGWRSAWPTGLVEWGGGGYPGATNVRVAAFECPSEPGFDNPHNYPTKNTYTAQNAWCSNYGFVSDTHEYNMDNVRTTSVPPLQYSDINYPTKAMFGGFNGVPKYR